MNMSKNSKRVAYTAIYIAIVLLFAFTPIGFVPVGLTNATTLHIPVILAGILEGPLIGAIVGFVFGITSIINAIIKPNPISLVFLNPIIAVVPRVLIGLLSGLVFKFMSKRDEKTNKAITLTVFTLIFIYYLRWVILYVGSPEIKTIIKVVNAVFLLLTLMILAFIIKGSKKYRLDIVVPTFVGTLVNTGLVLSFMYLIYGTFIEGALGLEAGASKGYILAIATTNAIPELIIAIVAVTVIASRVLTIERR